MFGIIEGFIDDLFAILFTGSILTFGISEAYFLIKKEALTKIQKGQPSLSKFTESLTCRKFDANMDLIDITSGHCKAKNSK